MFILDFFKKNLILKSENTSILWYRRILMVWFNLVTTIMFFVYFFIFFMENNVHFAFIKLLFAFLFLSLIIFFKDGKNQLIYGRLLSIFFATYSVISFLDPSEARFGFIWSFFVPFVCVFLIGYKQAIKIVFLYILIFGILGLYDVLYINNQFDNLIIFSLYYIAAVSFLFFTLFIDYYFTSIFNKIKDLSILDPLTKLYNRRKIDEILVDKFNENFVSLAISDIDNFKLVNDKEGHLVGDEILKLFADTLKDNIRNDDIVGRWGGEEFVIVLPNTSIEDAYICIEKLRKKIKDIKYKNLKNITSSFGISSSKYDAMSLNELISQADKALYEAKKQGKDRVVVYNKEYTF